MSAAALREMVPVEECLERRSGDMLNFSRVNFHKENESMDCTHANRLTTWAEVGCGEG